jgi:uncharacterized damage-inducible protein DinB
MNYYGAKDMAASWRTVRKNTIQVAEEIPEDKYSYRASPDTMSVAELLAHLATAPHSAQSTHFIEAKGYVGMEDFMRYRAEYTAEAATLKTKDAIIQALKTNGEKFAHQLESMTDAQLAEHVRFPEGLQPPSKTRFEMLLAVKEHEMHHRAQLFLIERMLGITPHLTRARQQQTQQRQQPQPQ